VASIFLCYRSGDDAYAAALLDEKLSQVFGADAIFRASRSIKPGDSYAEAITRALASCETILVLVGPTWVDRLAEATPTDVDWVRTEIVAALRNQVRVIPILLSRAPRLADRQLPADLAELARRQYLTFAHRDVDSDFARLVAALARADLDGGAATQKHHSHRRARSTNLDWRTNGSRL
jgi:hypothetical protein